MAFTRLEALHSRLSRVYGLLLVILMTAVLSLSATAQDDQPTSDVLDLSLPDQLKLPSSFVLNEIDLLELSNIGTGAPLSLDDIEPREALEEFTADQRVGEATREISVQEVRLIALENNLDLRAQFVRPSIADSRVQEEESRFDLIFGAGLAFEQREPIVDEGSPSVTLDGYNASVQLDAPLKTGGTFSISLPTTFTSPDVPGAEDVQDTSLQLSYTQPLLKNAGRKVAETPIEIAKLQSTQEQARTKLAAIQTLAAAETAYWDYYAAAEVLEIRYQQYQRALELERKAKRLAEARVISEIEVTRATAGVSRRLESIIVAESQRRVAQRSLKLQLNDNSLPLDGPTNFRTETSPDPAFRPLDRGKATELAVGNRLDLIDTQLQLSVEELGVLFSKNQLKPTLDLNASSTFSSRGDSLGDSLGSDFTSWQLGANFSLPIGNRGAKARARRSELQRSAAETNIQILRRTVAQQVLDSIDLLEQSFQRILAARQENFLAAKTYDAEERQFLAGVRTSTDVLEAADFLAEAQIREIQALASYERNKISAALATGTLLGKGQVRLPGIGIR